MIRRAHGRPGRRRPRSLLELLQLAGLTDGLKLCLDAGDSASYGGTGQSWLDRSGNGYDFFRGTGSGSDGADPAFSGTAGALSASEFFSFAGNDWFVYDQASNEAWMNTLHKDNAIFSTLAVVYIGAVTGVSRRWVGTHGSGGSNTPGIRVGTLTDETFDIAVGNGSTSFSPVRGAALTANSWHFCAGSVNEAAGATGGLGYVDGARQTRDATYTSPSASNASRMALGARDASGGLPMQNGDRLAWLACWEGVALTRADYDTLFALARPRFGL